MLSQIRGTTVTGSLVLELTRKAVVPAAVGLHQVDGRYQEWWISGRFFEDDCDFLFGTDHVARIIRVPVRASC